MNCPTCNHDCKGPGPHAPGKCERCNCGESEWVHGNPLYVSSQARAVYRPGREGGDSGVISGKRAMPVIQS